MQKRYLTPTAQNTHMTERYRLVAELPLRPVQRAALDEAQGSPGMFVTPGARRATVAGMPTTPAWYGAAKPKATVK